MEAFREISLIHISHLIADFKPLRKRIFWQTSRGIITFFFSVQITSTVIVQSSKNGAASESESVKSRETVIKLKVYVTFKGAVSRRSHSWTHALPSGDITPRLLPWAPALPLDKCRPLSWGCWTEWQLCHMSGLQDRCPSVPRSSATSSRTEQRVHTMFSCKYWLGVFLYCLSIFMRPACTFQTKSWSQSAPWIKL